MTAEVAESRGSGGLLLGCGMHDITGPAAERGMMGYANPLQKTGGIHMRLYSRAFVIQAEGEERLVFVSADLCMTSQAVKLEVVDRLQRHDSSHYSAANIMLSATHTHAGPGGYSHYTLYDLSTLGFDEQNFEAIVSGIVSSVLRAEANLALGRIRIAEGQLSGLTKNRSLAAYEKNPKEDTDGLPETNETMTVLRLKREDGLELGTINWFAIHGTSLDNQNRLISGDNKGYASYLFEHVKGRDKEPTFVAAFAQSDEGDNSPNVYGDDRNNRGEDHFFSLERSGARQFEAALSLYERASEVLPARIAVRHAFVDMSDVAIEPERVDGRTNLRTRSASIGASMLAGTEDGRGVGWEGLSRRAIGTWLERLATGVTLLLHIRPWRLKPLAAWWRLLVRRAEAPEDEKIEVIPTGRLRPQWTPQVLPLQVIQIGSLGIVAVPFELTTVAGRRLRRGVLSELRPAGVTRVVIAGLANAYAGYVTTHEEYDLQHYEGASTHFGPWTLVALQQHLEAMAAALVAGKEFASLPPPAPPARTLLDLQTSVFLDAPPPGSRPGRLRKDANQSYARGEKVVVSCWAGHPKNDLHTEGTFISVQRNDGETWVDVVGDHHPRTRFVWRRWLAFFLPFSTATAEWRIPEDAVPGTYRIRILGEGKPLFGPARSYAAESRPFTVR